MDQIVHADRFVDWEKRSQKSLIYGNFRDSEQAELTGLKLLFLHGQKTQNITKTVFFGLEGGREH